MSSAVYTSKPLLVLAKAVIVLGRVKTLLGFQHSACTPFVASGPEEKYRRLFTAPNSRSLCHVTRLSPVGGGLLMPASGAISAVLSTLSALLSVKELVAFVTSARK